MHSSDPDEVGDEVPECPGCGAPLDAPDGTCSECGWSAATAEALAAPPPAAEAPRVSAGPSRESYVPPRRTWPTLEPVAAGSPIFTYWPKSADGPVRYGVRCEDCGTLFVRDTPEEAREVAASREGHGAAYCAEIAKARRKPAESAPEAVAEAQSVETPLVKPKPPKAKPASGATKKRGAAA